MASAVHVHSHITPTWASNQQKELYSTHFSEKLDAIILTTELSLKQCSNLLLLPNYFDKKF